ncbi:hypothetical protein HGRIS_004245 [Hohenbuehelia grisea]|uniref:Uncharacterized protein n=1 Tax=Hohenbuehelia grisea TaxID=104357 RepID=A0ABR3IP77_9AGAR
MPYIITNVDQMLRVESIPKGLTLTVFNINTGNYDHEDFTTQVTLPNGGVYGHAIEESKQAPLHYKVSGSKDPKAGVLATVNMIGKRTFMGEKDHPGGFAEIFYRLHGTTTVKDKEVKIDTKGTIAVHTTGWKVGSRPDTSIISYSISCHAPKIISVEVPEALSPQSVSFVFAVDTDAGGKNHVAIMGVPTDKTLLEEVTGMAVNGIFEVAHDAVATAAGSLSEIGAVAAGLKSIGKALTSHFGAWSIGQVLDL